MTWFVVKLGAVDVEVYVFWVERNRLGQVVNGLVSNSGTGDVKKF